MTLNSTGLGIGTTPSTNLHVLGNTIISNDLIVGSNSNSSQSNLHLSGTSGQSFITTSSNLSGSDLTSSVIFADASSQDIQIELPYAGNVSGRKYLIKQISDSGNVFITGGGNSIDDKGDVHLTGNSTFSKMEFMSNGSQWYIIRGAADIVASENLIFRAKLDETSGTTYTDSSIYARTATGFSASGNSVKGKQNNALHFGNTQALSFGAISPALINNEITLTGWAYFDTVPSGVDRILTVTGEIAVIRRASSNAHFYIKTGGTLRHMTGATLTAGNWAHIAGTWDGTTQILYVNGVEVNRATPGNSLNDASASSALVCNGAAESIDGYIDDCRIYNRALSAAEIKAIYLGGEE